MLHYQQVRIPAIPVFHQDQRHVYCAPAFQALDWLEHGFGTRLSRNWPGERLVQLKQVHSARVVIADGDIGNLGEGDALITSRPGLLLGIRTADCLPILMADRRRRAIAAVHAGWRGTVQQIGPAALQALRDHFGTNPEDVVVAIGHGIGACCYKVGPEVASRFRQYFPTCANLSIPTHIDLVEVNKRQLTEAGVLEERISTSGLCTRCTPEMESYRRDGDRAGRMISVIGIRA